MKLMNPGNVLFISMMVLRSKYGIELHCKKVFLSVVNIGTTTGC